tara:strand:- start:4172 stop:4375 length:204 start_codon:yes stop_codon:yes gene_type:complete
MVLRLVVLLMLGGCSPLFGVGSLVHSLVTGNTAGIISGGAGLAVEETTGKTVTEHIIDKIEVDIVLN